MKVGTKLILSLSIPIVVLIGLFGYLDEHRSRAHYRMELKREGRAITRTVQLSMEDALRDRQLSDVRELVDLITGYERVLGVRVFDPEGKLDYQSAILVNHPVLHPEALAQVLKTHQPIETYRKIDGQPVVTFIYPLLDHDGRLMGAVQVLQLESFINEEVRASRNGIIALTFVVILGAGAVLFIGIRLVVVRPVDELVRSIRHISHGDFRSRVPTRPSNDELTRLADEFNTMTGRLEAARSSLIAEQEERRRAEEQLRNTEKLASLGRMAAGLAHEIGTPLNVISGRAERLRRRLPVDDPQGRSLAVITDQIDRIARIVRGMLEFAQMKEPHLATIDVARVLYNVTELLSLRMEEAGVRLEWSLPGRDVRALADADQIHQVFLNLAVNALDAMKEGGVLRVTVHEVLRNHPARADRGEEEFVAVQFEDTGCGIEPDDLGRVFDPFFTTKTIGEGTGLGLSISHGIVQEHGGWIEIESRRPGGTRVTVHLPAAPAPAPAEPSETLS